MIDSVFLEGLIKRGNGGCDGTYQGCSSDMAVEHVWFATMKIANIIHDRLPKARIVLLGLLPRANQKLASGAIPSSDFYNYPSRCAALPKILAS